MTLESVLLDRLPVGLAAPADPNANPLVGLIPIALVLAIFYFVLLLPMRKRQRKIADFQSNLKAGDQIVTTSGIYGTIAKIREKTVVLEVADRVRIEVSKTAIGGRQGEAPVVSESGSLG